MVPDKITDGNEAVYHPLSCVINKRFNSLEWNDNCMDLGLAEIWTFPYPPPPIMLNPTTMQVQNSARE